MCRQAELSINHSCFTPGFDPNSTSTERKHSERRRLVSSPPPRSFPFKHKQTKNCLTLTVYTQMAIQDEGTKCSTGLIVISDGQISLAKVDDEPCLFFRCSGCNKSSEILLVSGLSENIYYLLEFLPVIDPVMELLV